MPVLLRSLQLQWQRALRITPGESAAGLEFRISKYDNDDNFMNKTATSKAVTAVLIGLLSVVGLVAQTKPTRTPQAAAKVVPVESAEHAFARISLEELTKTMREIGMMIACLDPSSELAKLYTCPKKDAAIQANLHDACPDMEKAAKFQGQPTPAKICAMAFAGTVVSMFGKEEMLKKKLAAVETCKMPYTQTIDMKTSDLTTRQTELIAGCRSLDLHPPPTQLRTP